MSEESSARALTSTVVWFHSLYGERLHFVPKADTQGDFFDDATHSSADTTANAICGLRCDWMAPGVFSRMGMPRCQRCCKALGIPRGSGCPLNQEALR